jgi:alkanesulfonate monooxygenase SsuD/methylene tetrahydromethanopterin reductase-like flavin-dependent oxidoreductase (luciferase family)
LRDLAQFVLHILSIRAKLEIIISEETPMVLALGVMVDSEEDLTASTWLEIVKACDEYGFDALFRSEHFLRSEGSQEFGSLDAWTSCAAAAVCSSRIKLGTLVSPVTFRHPAVLAKTILTVDHMSGGRAELGLGIGWNEVEHRSYGLAFPGMAQRYEMLEEQLQILELLWGPERSMSFDGKHYNLAEVSALPKPIKKPSIIVGKRGQPRSVGIAVRWADEYNMVYATLDEAKRLRQLLDRQCAQAQRTRPLRLSVVTDFAIGNSTRQARERLEIMAGRHSWMHVDELISEAEDRFLAGYPRQLVEKLLRYQDVGVDRVILKLGSPIDVDQIRLLGSEVLPRTSWGK